MYQRPFSSSTSSQIANSLAAPFSTLRISSAEEEKRTITAEEWFKRELSRTLVQVNEQTADFLTKLHEQFYKHFLSALKQLKNTVWHKKSKPSQELCYARAYQEAKLNFAYDRLSNPLPNSLILNKEALNLNITELLRNVIATEAQAESSMSDEQEGEPGNAPLSDLAHYAHGILALHQKGPICSYSDKEQQATLDHFRAAFKLTEYPMAAIQLAYFTKTGIAPADSMEARIKQVAEYYQVAAEQENASAQSHIGTFYLKGVLGTNLSLQEREDLGYSWIKRAAENGNASAIKNIAALNEKIEFICSIKESYKTI